jgi:hypothetical protein
MWVRVHELKWTDPTLSKKSYWRIAQGEWIKLQCKQKQATREALLAMLDRI